MYGGVSSSSLCLGDYCTDRVSPRVGCVVLLFCSLCLLYNYLVCISEKFMLWLVLILFGCCNLRARLAP